MAAQPDLGSPLAYTSNTVTMVSNIEVQTLQPKNLTPDICFRLFPCLPPEIRHQIWRTVATPRVIRWIRQDHSNVFSTPLRAPPMSDICQESREIIFLHGQYVNVSDSRRPVYFSPIMDYLLLDPGWHSTHPSVPPPRHDPLDFLPPDLMTLRNIMVYPNYSEERKVAATRFEKLQHLRQILVVGDEKSIGFQSKFTIGTVYDIKNFYHIQRIKKLVIKIPDVAVGCLGWTGEERRKIHHGEEDGRKLVAIFRTHAEMKAHQAMVRAEEWKFIQELKLAAPKMKLKFRLAQPHARISTGQQTLDGTPIYQHIPSEPPAYSEIPSTLPTDNGSVTSFRGGNDALDSS